VSSVRNEANFNTDLRLQEVNLRLSTVSFTFSFLWSLLGEKCHEVVKTYVLNPRYPGSKFPPDDRLKGILWEFSRVSLAANVVIGTLKETCRLPSLVHDFTQSIISVVPRKCVSC
jgi:hypothetical protein